MAIRKARNSRTTNTSARPRQEMRIASAAGPLRPIGNLDPRNLEMTPGTANALSAIGFDSV
jgi:hypothetical protein